MPLVFIHGIKTREGKSYSTKVEVRNHYFRRTTFAANSEPDHLQIFNPYWGDLGAGFAWGHAYLPAGTYEAFGDDQDVFGDIVDAHAPPIEFEASETLLTIARQRSLVAAVDCLWSAAAFVSQPATESDDEPAAAAELAAMGRKAMLYAESGSSFSWISAVPNDRKFVEVFFDEVKAWSDKQPATAVLEQFGSERMLGTLLAAAGRLTRAASSLAEKGSRAVHVLANRIEDSLRRGLATAGKQLKSFAVKEAANLLDPIAGLLVDRLHKHVAEAVGDIFVYIDQRGDYKNPGPISERVIANLKRANDARSDADNKLIVVGHSLGGVIAYDILTHFLPNYHCDSLITVGSQIGLFEELNLFRRSVSGQKPPLPKPANIQRWINLFDSKDPLGYSVRRIFSDAVEDYEFDTQTNTFISHTEYFTQPSFFERLRVRLGPL